MFFTKYKSNTKSHKEAVPLFSCTRLGQKTRERICTIDGSKRVKSGKDVPFGGFVEKIFTPTPNIPQIPKILHYESSFWRKTSINLGGSAAKIQIRIGNSQWGFQVFAGNYGNGLSPITLYHDSATCDNETVNFCTTTIIYLFIYNIASTF